MKIAVILWFLIEVFSLWIQIFAVSSLTHLESYRYEGSNFYNKHRNWAGIWAGLFFFVGGVLLLLHFVSESNFQEYKLYYKYYSESTLTFWLCFSLVFILVLTDRYLAYEGFKKREREGSHQHNEQPSIQDLLQLYTRQLDVNLIKNELDARFEGSQENERVAGEIVDIYTKKMKTHVDEIQRMIKGLNDQNTHQTSMGYITFLLIFNTLNLIGYIFMLVAYKNYKDTDNRPDPYDSGLEFFLIGFSITSLATFAYELSHNFLFYRSFYVPVYNYWILNSQS